MNEEEKIIEDIEEIINRCKECKFAACEQCEINWTQVKTLEHLLCLYKQEKQKNKELNERINKSIEFINDDNTFFDDGENWQNVLHIEELLKGE